MAYYSIEKRETADGTLRYRCTVGVKEGGKYLHRERKTFSKLSLAKSWGVGRVAFLEEHGVSDDTKTSTQISLSDLIDKYMRCEHVKFGRSKRNVLRFLQKCDIASIPLSQLSEASYINHCTYRRLTASPSTVRQDFTYIFSVLNSAKPLFDIDVDLKPFNNAYDAMSKMNMTGSSNRRNRRPTHEELESLVAALKIREVRSNLKIPFSDIFSFSILTCMRIGEVTRINWDDVDIKTKSVLVRDRKDPRKKIGNHMVVPLLGDAWDILERQVKRGDRVFPFKERSITQTYRQVRDSLGISDLRYHDLRREGASRLFEAGFSLEEVAQVTGHRSLSTLWNVYREIFPQSLHDKFAALQDNKKAYVAK
ncbi:integrase [Serratia sp. Leaf50]|nr:integrase [Serratia sp. Leaf50]